jgi:hypothetical protein
MASPVRLKHVEGSAVFLQLLNGIVKKVLELVEIVLRLSN